MTMRTAAKIRNDRLSIVVELFTQTSEGVERRLPMDACELRELKKSSVIHRRSQWNAGESVSCVARRRRVPVWVKISQLCFSDDKLTD